MIIIASSSNSDDTTIWDIVYWPRFDKTKTDIGYDEFSYAFQCPKFSATDWPNWATGSTWKSLDFWVESGPPNIENVETWAAHADSFSLNFLCTRNYTTSVGNAFY